MVVYSRVSSRIAELHGETLSQKKSNETNSENSEGAARNRSWSSGPCSSSARLGFPLLWLLPYTCICGGTEMGLYSQQPCKSMGRGNICLLCERSRIPECRLGTWIYAWVLPKALVVWHLNSPHSGTYTCQPRRLCQGLFTLLIPPDAS